MEKDLNRFLIAQENSYEIALSEIKLGKKRSHWMWYIFPQYQGLGQSNTSKSYAIKSSKEAEEFLNHPVLGIRLREISSELLKLEKTNALSIFGSPDDLKLKSSMTLFFSVDDTDDSIFKKVLDRYFEGLFDHKTLKLIKE